MASDPSAELREPEAYRTPDLECDVVMKGGITSGVVYPLAVCELARRYRLVSVGGASAGAIAAVAAAAAEHGRHSPSGGFATLAALPVEIASKLTHLFQPQRGTRSVFRLLVVVLAKPQSWQDSIRRLISIAGAYVVALLRSGRYLALGLLPAAAVALIAFGLDASVLAAWAPGLLLAAAATAVTAALLVSKRVQKACCGVTAAVLAVGLALLWDGVEAVPFAVWVIGLAVAFVAGSLLAITLAAGRSIAGNSFGLITGTKPSVRQRGSEVEPLCDWLHEVVNAAAGRSAQAAPLTFGDLSGGRKDDPHEVRLVVQTTCLTQSRSYRIPNDFASGRDVRDRWFFDETELRKVLPEPVVDHLVANPPSPPDRDAAQWAWLQQALAPLKPLPEPEHWPIVMAARMSLSFPVLLSAVPLRKVDWSLEENGGALDAWRADKGSRLVPRAERCWFSDGGITSNFPVHFFDSLLPRRPTFGINLRGFHPNRAWAAEPRANEAEKVYRPPNNSGGMDEWWSRFEDGKSGLGALLAFLGTIKTTALNWGDNEQMKVPGYRDRVAHISHTRQEGGLNLTMPPPVVDSLSERGRIAGAVLRDAFTTPATGERTTDWRNHKWVRLRTSTALLDEALRSILLAYDDGDTSSYRALLRLGRDEQPSYELSNPPRDLIRRLYEGLGEEIPGDGLLAAAGQLEDARAGDGGVALERDAPSPLPELRVMPGHRPRGGVE